MFAKIDTEAESALAGAVGIMSIPTLMVFREGVLVFSQPGALPGPALEQIISQVRQLDMEQVHRSVAAARPRADGSSPSPSCEFRVRSPITQET